MKKVFKFTLLVICFIITLSVFTVNESNANSASTLQLSSSNNNNNSDIIIFVRVMEGSRVFIYIYTDGGIYLTKYEEL